MTTTAEPGATQTPDEVTSEYELRISRLTVDKLGVKLYDKASAVVAELIANSYDADAENVIVSLPLGTELARVAKDEEGKPKIGDDGQQVLIEHGYEIIVEDDGHGMTPEEAKEYFLDVGRDRRRHVGQGSRSRIKKRPVMGRKGIGKLAPFGICKRIEIISAGGPKTESGFLVSNFVMEFDDIVQDEDGAVPLPAGPENRTFRNTSGTTIKLSSFLPRRVPSHSTFMRQVERRFALVGNDFDVVIGDTRPDTEIPNTTVQRFNVPIEPETRIDLKDRPVSFEDGTTGDVTGWLAMGKEAYKDEEVAGVRIYARGKIVATTRDFEQPAGFTGEFAVRSYLVGEVHAEWLDLDEGEDLVRTDRQDILWDSELGAALRSWGADLIKEIGNRSREPRRTKVRKRFLEVSRIEEHVRERFGDSAVTEAAIELASQIGGFAAEDELEDESYVAGLRNVIAAVAPHKALMDAFHDFSKAVSAEAGDEVDTQHMHTLVDLFGKTRIAELASYSQIASERVQAITSLEHLVYTATEASEADFQRIVESAPYLIDPTWSVISQNQPLKSFKLAFEAFWKDKHGDEIEVAIEYQTKRPDFVLVHAGGKLNIVELKNRKHAFADDDFDRMYNYVVAFRAFTEAEATIMAHFPKGWGIVLVADAVNIKDEQKSGLYEALLREHVVERITWNAFLDRAKQAHQTFLDARDEAAKRAEEADGT